MTFAASATRWRETAYAAPGEAVGTASMALTMTALDDTRGPASFDVPDRAALSGPSRRLPCPTAHT